jgi:multicomponent Na+:H+ antiporter subunit E
MGKDLSGACTLNRTFLRNTIIEAVLMMVFWLIMSGHYDLMHVSFGIFSVILVLLINHSIRRHIYTLGEYSDALKLSLVRVIYYVPWLLWQIVVASLQVAYVVLHPKCPVDPALLRFKTRLANTSSRVILGNSITLTPGTITLDIEQEVFLVHSLMDISSTGIIDGTLPGEVAKLYERRPGQVVRDIKVIKTEADM